MRWLHISDVHYNPDTDGRSSAQLRKKLPEYLTEHRRVDEVFVTGDFRFRSNQEDTDEVAEESVKFILQLAESIGVTDPKHIHIVPGNHDLTRSPIKGKKSFVFSDIYSCDSGRFEPGDADRLLERFSFFKRVCAKLYTDGSIWSDSAQLKSIHKYRCFDKYSILYMNTAIACNGEKDERGKLVIGNDDLYTALEAIKAEKADAPIIVLAHHGIGCFSKREREVVEQLFREYSVKLYLCGDSHSVWCRLINQTPEITMGCIKQESGMQAAFSIGELQPDGFIKINVHHWDPRAGGWQSYTAFDEEIKRILPQLPSGPAPSKMKTDRGATSEEPLKVFVMYSWEDDVESSNAYAMSLCNELRRYGMDAFCDVMSHESDTYGKIENAIDTADRCVIILTPSYVKKMDDLNTVVNFETDLLTKRFKEKVDKTKNGIVFVIKTKTTMPEKWKGFHHEDFTKTPKMEDLVRFLKDIAPDVNEVFQTKPDPSPKKVPPIGSFYSNNEEPKTTEQEVSDRKNTERFVHDIESLITVVRTADYEKFSIRPEFANKAIEIVTSITDWLKDPACKKFIDGIKKIKWKGRSMDSSSDKLTWDNGKTELVHSLNHVLLKLK